MIIGNFKYDPDHNTYTGEIRTLSLTRPNVVFRPTRKSGDREPDYRVLEEGPNGVIEFGAAWQRRSEKGQAFLSALLDDPALPQALSVALFDDRDGKATLVWNRPRAPKHEPEAQADASRPATKRASPTRTARAG